MKILLIYNKNILTINLHNVIFIKRNPDAFEVRKSMGKGLCGNGENHEGR